MSGVIRKGVIQYKNTNINKIKSTGNNFESQIFWSSGNTVKNTKRAVMDLRFLTRDWRAHAQCTAGFDFRLRVRFRHNAQV